MSTFSRPSTAQCSSLQTSLLSLPEAVAELQFPPCFRINLDQAPYDPKAASRLQRRGSLMVTTLYTQFVSSKPAVQDQHGLACTVHTYTALLQAIASCPSYEMPLHGRKAAAADAVCAPGAMCALALPA